ncbi:hypothetical protein [Streptomyces sp. NPDC012616]|uniref:hypothetical protein n=1 Tax=Streptomyces sp. NPDC012616 TaxID=3364840 RepID=UPI0036E52591
MSLSSPLGTDGPSVEIQGSDGVVVAAHGLPIKAFSGLVDGKPQVGPSAPFSYEVVVPSAAACPGHSLAEAMGDTSAQHAGSSTLTVTVSDPAVARHRAAHGGDASSALLVASWPPDPNAVADGAGTAPGLEDVES